MIESVCRIAYVKSPRTLSLLIPEARFYLINDYAQKEAKRVLALSLRRWVRPRTTGEKSQNHAIHGFATQIANHTGHEKSEVITIAKKRALKRGYPVRTFGDGELLLSPFDGEPIPESEKYIDVEQAGYLIDELTQIAAELDVHLKGSQ